MIDTHCHLYSEEFTSDIAAVIQRADERGVSHFFLPAIDHSTHQNMMALEQSYPGKVFSMIGLHPCSVKENYKEEMAVIEMLLGERKFAGIGETGLDFYWDKTFVNQQYECFETQAELALQYGLPLILHTREAMQECIDVVKKYAGRGLKGIFHCFGGSLAEAKQIIDLGFHLGIGGVVTYKNSGLDKVLIEVPLEKIVLETDAPYLSPVPYRGKRNESSYLPAICKKIAEIKVVSEAEVAAATTANALEIFKAAF